MNKLFLTAIAILLGLSLLIDNSFFRPSARRVASSTHDSTPLNSAQNNDLSELDAVEFSKAFKYHLLGTSRLVKSSLKSGVAFGNFYIRGSEGQKNFVCSKYTNLELTFEAEGVAISGSIPKMVVRGPCLNATDFSTIEPLLVPYRKILASPITQRSFQENLPESSEKIQVDFIGVVEQWPTQWNLVKLQMQSPEGDTLTVNGYEIIAIVGEPITLDWHQ